MAKPPDDVASIVLATPNPALGVSVSFTSAPTDLSGPPKSQPRIQVMAYQDGVLVYGEAGPASQSFLLGGAGSAWLTNGGPAHCVADLFFWSYKGGQQTFELLASTEFDAAG
jgi:hypothetical protein